MGLNVTTLGQVFTPTGVVSDMLSLRKNLGRVMEPSCGAGAFSDHIPDCVAIEYDKGVCPRYALNMDFFDYPVSEQFETIIGNPPYVRYQSIAEATKAKLDKTLFDERANLYLFFIEKCIRHLTDGGELIFITPRDFMKATSAVKLNEYLYANGTITDLVDLGDTQIFPGFSPNCVIFRYEKGNYSRRTNVSKKFATVNGQLLFTSAEYTVPFSSLFFVKVGAVSGADAVFASPNGNMDFVCSTTVDSGLTKRMFYDTPAAELEPHIDILLSRRIKTFNKSNWWAWGRGYYESDKPRIYVNAKTRRTQPFFTHDCKAYDGSMLAIFPKMPRPPIKRLVSALNTVDWGELGFICDGRHLFSQRALEGCLLPESFKKFL